MVRLTDIENAIRQLPPDQLTALREWFAKFDAEAWDEQLANDVASGRLDALKDEAVRDVREGRATDL